jgi:hypothetical protein
MYDEAPIFTLKKVMGREKFHDPEKTLTLGQASREMVKHIDWVLQNK